MYTHKIIINNSNNNNKVYGEISITGDRTENKFSNHIFKDYEYYNYHIQKSTYDNYINRTKRGD